MEKELILIEERRPYIKPEADMIVMNLSENIASSRVIDDEFDGEDDVFA